MEGADFVRKVDAAVDALVQEGIVRPDKVALSGFSRGGYLAYYAMTHPARTCFAAAAVNDATTESYQQYVEISGVAGSDYAIQYAAVNRNPWQDPLYWLREDVMLNADRVPGPMLFSQTDTYDPARYSAVSLQTIGTLILNRKPFDYVYLPRAVHHLASPVQQVLLRQAVVDWMSFWLNAQENPDPAMASRNQRWRKLHGDWAETRSHYLSRGEEGFVRSRSGLEYAIRTRLTGTVPKSGNVLTVHYVAKGPDGRELANTYTANTPLEIRLNATPPGDPRLVSDEERVTRDLSGSGWDEGLRLLHAGEKATFIMPRELAPAGEGARESVPAGTPVRYELELRSVQ